MIKSLYTRVVLVFVGTVILTLLLADAISGMLFMGRIHSLIEEMLLANGQKIIQAYQLSPDTELVPFVQTFTGMMSTNLQLYDREGMPLLSGSSIPVTPAHIQQVLAGEVVRNLPGLGHYPIVGIPLAADGKPYALFLAAEQNSIDAQIMHSMHVVYLVILLCGSILILVAARYIVNPIRRLTGAAKRIASGKFDLELQTKRKDEIGQLTVTFNEMARELSKLDRMRQEFVSNVSHEIQTPLTSISGFSKALKQKQMSEESRLQYLTIIEEESERLSRLGQNLLRLSSLQQQAQPLKLSAYRLDEQLRRVVIALEPQWSAKHLELDIELPVLNITGDEDQLYQVWTNLIGNSIKFTPADGIIRITAAQNGSTCSIQVVDSGIGIPPEEQADIFKPFHKVDKARDRSIKGNGLGLSIVKQIVELHQGTITVSSQLGQGTTFTVTLPLKA